MRHLPNKALANTAKTTKKTMVPIADDAVDTASPKPIYRRV
jgi:hypothetical protein